MLHRGVSLQDYLPRTPIAGGVPASDLFESTWAGSPHADQLERICAAAVDVLGSGQTVWRVRNDGSGSLSWELYWWSHAERQPLDALELVLSKARIELHPDIDRTVLSRLAPLCLSFDLPLAGPDTLGAINLYMPLLPATAGYYSLGGGDLTFQGTQTRYELPEQLDKFQADVAASPHLLSSPLDEVVPIPIRRTRWLYLTHKPTCDGIYSAGLDLASFEWFLETFRYPPALCELVASKRDRLGHLCFDVGYNVTTLGGGTRFGTSGFYGSI